MFCVNHVESLSVRPSNREPSIEVLSIRLGSANQKSWLVPLYKDCGMRFPFFSQRKKSSSLKDVAKAKMSRMCCFHAPTEGVIEADERETSQKEDSKKVTLKEDPFVSKPVLPRPLRCSPSQGSTTSSISPLEAIVTDPPQDRAPSRQTRALQEFCEQFGFNASPNVANGESSWREGDQLGASTSSYSPSQASSAGWCSRRGPGLGSAADNPPSRMLMESLTPDINALKQPRWSTRRGEATGVTAPDLPTRLEVCSGSTRNEKPALFDSAVSMHSDNLDSHPLNDPVSPYGSSASTEGSYRSPIKNTAQASKSEERKRGTLSHSPYSPSTESALKTTMQDQPTKLTAETDSEFRRLLSQSMKESTTNQSRRNHNVKQDTHPKLHQWKVYLKLDWVSDSADDLVAEVYPIQDPLPYTSLSDQLTATPGTRDDFKYQQSEINPCPFGVEGSVESEIAQIVDRVFCELKTHRKRKTKPINKGRRRSHETRGVQAIEDPRSKHQDLTKDRDRSKHLNTPHPEQSAQLQRRLEVLKAFESLVSRMEEKMHFSGILFLALFAELRNCVLGIAEERGDMPLERRLSDAILCDLKQEIERLTDRLCNLKMAKHEESFGKASLSHLPNEPKTHRYAASFGSKPTLSLFFKD